MKNGLFCAISHCNPQCAKSSSRKNKLPAASHHYFGSRIAPTDRVPSSCPTARSKSFSAKNDKCLAVRASSGEQWRTQRGTLHFCARSFLTVNVSVDFYGYRFVFVFCLIIQMPNRPVCLFSVEILNKKFFLAAHAPIAEQTAPTQTLSTRTVTPNHNVPTSRGPTPQGQGSPSGVWADPNSPLTEMIFNGHLDDVECDLDWLQDFLSTNQFDIDDNTLNDVNG